MSKKNHLTQYMKGHCRFQLKGWLTQVYEGKTVFIVHKQGKVWSAAVMWAQENLEKKQVRVPFV